MTKKIFTTIILTIILFCGLLIGSIYLSRYLTNIQSKIKDEELKIVTYQKELAEKQDTINNLQSKLIKVSTELNSVNDTIKNLNDKNTTLNNQISDLTKQLKEEELKTEQNEMLINSLNTQISNLSSDIETNEKTITELNKLKINYENEIKKLNNDVIKYKDEYSNLKYKYEEILNGYEISIDNVQRIEIVDHNDETKFVYGNSNNNRVNLSYLIDMNLNDLKVKYLNGVGYFYVRSNSPESGYIPSPGANRLKGNVELWPEETEIDFFLRDPVNEKYIDFNNESINYLIGLGYTTIGYSIYAINYANGLLSFHFNFRNCN